MSNDLLSWLESQRDSMLALLKRLVELESPSTDKKSVDRVGKVFAEELEACGANVTELPSERFGNHLRATVGDSPPEGQILILGHLDTVWELGTLQELPFRIEDGIAHGPGTFDMKGGLVQLVFALRALSEAGRAPTGVTALVNSDEEVGSLSSRPYIEEEARRSRVALVLEPSLPPNGKLKTFRKGGGVFRLHVKGREAHAGLDPEKGLSAIEELARQIRSLHELTDLDRGITVNVGLVRGGTRSNVIAGDAHAEIDVRVSTVADAREMEEKILNVRPLLEGAEVDVKGSIDRLPLERSPAVVALYQKARSLASEIGFELEEGSAGGGSDGNITAGLGVPTLDGLGAVGDGAHARNEHLLIDELPRRAALLARLLETL
ncbi:MAG: M20 family metallopeptidase [Vicinamibacteria bacterium]